MRGEKGNRIRIAVRRRIPEAGGKNLRRFIKGHGTKICYERSEGEITELSRLGEDGPRNECEEKTGGK